MSESWWPKPQDRPHPSAYEAGYKTAVEDTLEAVAQRMAEKELVFFESYFKPDGIQDRANRRWLGLERKEG